MSTRNTWSGLPGLTFFASALLLFECCAGARELTGGSRPTIQVPLGRPAPDINSGITDPRWAVAACASGFITDDRDWAAAQTSTLLLSGGGHLYFAFKCLAPPAELKARQRPDDSLDIFGDESVELFLQPELDGDTYYHLAFNAVGSKYSARCVQAKRDESWNPELELKVGRFNDGWWLAGKIPLAQLGPKPKVADKWGINCCRNQKTPLLSSSSWTGQSDFNAPKEFGVAVFAAQAGLDFSMLEMSPAHLSLVLRNNSGKELNAQISVTSQKSSSEKTIPTQPGVASPLIIDGRFIEWTTLDISVPDTDCRIERTAFVDPSIPPLIILERYYCPPEMKTLAGKVIGLPGGVKYNIVLYRDSAKTPEQSRDIGSARESFAFDISALEPGRHIVVATALDASGKKLATNSKTVFIKQATSMPPLPKEQDFRLDGCRFILNGQLFFPFMGSENTVVSPLVKDCFNVKYGSLGVRENAPVRGVCGVAAGRRENGRFFYLLGPEETVLERVKKTIATQKALFYNLQYEVHIPLYRNTTNGLVELNPPQEYAKIYQHIKAASPETLVSIHTHDYRKAGLYMNSGDIFEVATWKSSYAKNMFKNLYDDIKTVREQIGNKPLIWWLGASIPTAEARDAEMVRGATYLAVMNRVNGIIYHLGHDGIPPEQTQLWSVFGGLANEVETIYPLAQAAAPDPADYVSVDSAAINCMATRRDKQLFIIALNTSAEPVNGKLKFRPDVQADAEVMFENRSIKPVGNAIGDLFTGFEPHVYRVKLR